MLTLPLGAALLVLNVSFVLFIYHLAAIIRFRNRKNCVEKCTAVVITGSNPSLKQNGNRAVRFKAIDGLEYEIVVDLECIDSSFFLCKKGEKVPILYDPQNPNNVIIGTDNITLKKLPRYLQICKFSIIAVTLAAGCLLFLLLK